MPLPTPEESLDSESEPDEELRYKKIFKHNLARTPLPLPKSSRPLEQASKGEQKMQAELDELNILGTIEPEGLNNLEDEWEELEMAVDSGATETVVGLEMLKAIKLIEGQAFKRGVKYEVANGVRIPNMGEKTFVGTTDDGTKREITAQVCDVNKPLLSVSKMVAAGNRVVFEQDSSYIENIETGERVWLKERGGMYMIKLWVKKSF